MNNKEKALAKYFIEQGDTAREAIEQAKDYDDYEYFVLDDNEADKMVRDYILDTVWAFNKDFLDAHSEAIENMSPECFAKIQEMCEGANNTVIRLIDDIDYFVEDAITSDGRGHFLSSYDGQEHEYLIDGKYYFVYKN